MAFVFPLQSALSDSRLTTWQEASALFLRYLIPGEIFVIGSRPEELDVSATFAHRGYAVRLALRGGEVREIEKPAVRLRFVRMAEGLQIVLNDEPAGAAGFPLRDLIQADRHSELFLVMREIGSRVCRAIRNYAAVPEMPERLIDRVLPFVDVKTYLLRWSPETSADGHSWAELIPQEVRAFRDLLVAARVERETQFYESAQLFVLFWPGVAEALEDAKDPPPELEFYANAMGHLRQKNFRLAVVESIICLEVVLSQFLSQHLTVAVSLPKKRLRQFLSPDVGLSARLSALLNLTLHESYLEDVDFDRVMKVVEWRNQVVHKTGRLPPHIPEDTLEKGVDSVLSLARMLAERRDNVAASPELRNISEALRKTEKMLWPQIWLKPGHRVRMDIQLTFIGRPAGYRETLDAVTKEAAKLLKNRDPRFEPGKHLTIHFKDLADKSIGWFSAGVLHITEEGKKESNTIPS